MTLTRTLTIALIDNGFMTCLACVKQVAETVDYKKEFLKNLSKPKTIYSDKICSKCSRNFGSEDSEKAACWLTQELYEAGYFSLEYSSNW